MSVELIKDKFSNYLIIDVCTDDTELMVYLTRLTVDLINCLREANKSGAHYNYEHLFDLLEALVPTDEIIEQVKAKEGKPCQS